MLMLILSFSVFYVLIEVLLAANRQILGPQNIANTFELVLLSFLNLAPAGVFAFAIVSVLPKRFVSSNTDENLISMVTPSSSQKGRFRVASLYTTYNDFMQQYALYNLTESRRRGRGFFILDDSTDPIKKAEVDDFAREYQCKVARRDNRKGYKAGAINAWLRSNGHEYDYVFILDSDSQASAFAIDYCVELAKRDPKLAVIQSKTMTMTSTPNKLTKAGVTIQHAYMAVVQAAMKNLGTSPFYGHNALLKVEALRSLNGMVEESNEDYKTLARLQDRGYHSIYASNAVTEEEIPPDYFSSRKRSLRWARDAVGQLGLLRYKAPGAMRFYLVYGWATYMANIAMLGFLLLLAYNGFMPLQPGGSVYLAEVAGVMTMTVIILWPLLSLRVKDSELTIRKILTAVVWSSIFSAPMMGPVSAQIVKTSLAQVYVRAKVLLGGTRSKLVEEFVVTPKVKLRNQKFTSVLSSLRMEFAVGSLPFIVAGLTGAVYFLLFSSLQLFMLVALPVLIFAESTGLAKSKHTRVKYSRGHSPIFDLQMQRLPTIQSSQIEIQNQYVLQTVSHRVR